MNDLAIPEAREKKSPTSGAIIAWVSAASAVWLLAGILGLGYFAKSTASCDGTFSCLTIDAWGTYLSGVFAPLAFFWLVATVWIQSRELAQQREELVLTRQEFAHSREVMKAQAEEAANSARYIGLQTEILKRQEEQQILERRRNEFQYALNNLHGIIKHRLWKTPCFVGTNTGGNRGSFGITTPIPSDRDETIVVFSKYVQSGYAAQGWVNAEFEPAYQLSGVEAFDMADRAIDLVNQIDDFAGSEVRRLGIFELSHQLKVLCKMDPNR
ncbi:hypothetical protein RHECIAT_CH0003828 [Rhizobium etli CIAT 652]|uniref:Uncharacterized protein n=1 Tax=Rhizobium etli (strain CIAT 652) TaxID=491916 RepID=B3PZW6_RHIE6|nr:hypothetical protein RHECIAT_CH0003828 [Rhizobium etli CIAT 652]